jgi:hypothetical protein
MLKYAVALGLAGVAAVSIAAVQEPGCPADTQRRQPAVRFARMVNTAEASFHAQNKRYGQISELAVGAEPDGFHAQLTTDATGYALSIKDAVDACQFALFSDQLGVIYAAQPIR